MWPSPCSRRTVVYVSVDVSEIPVARDAPGASGRDRRRDRRVPALVSVAVLVPSAFVLLLPAWVAAEAALAGRLAAAVVRIDVVRHGAEVTATGETGRLTLLVVGWCSSLAPVLAVVALGVLLRGPVAARVRAVVLAVILLVVANVVRLAALVWWGATVDLATVDRVHDGVGTAFAVVVVLLAAAVVLLSPSGAPLRRRDRGDRIVRP